MNKLVFLRVVKCFYCNMKFEEEEPITTNINGLEIKFDVGDICKILDIPNKGLCLYESKKWLKVDGFKPIEVVQRLCSYNKAIMTNKPTSQTLTLLSRTL